MEYVDGYLLKNSKGQFLSKKFTWTYFSRKNTKEFDTLKECDDIKSKRPTAKVVEVVSRYTFKVNPKRVEFERIERLMKNE